MFSCKRSNLASMNIRRPDILLWIASGCICLGMGEIYAQVLTAPPGLGNDTTTVDLSPKIVTYPVNDAYTADRLMFSTSTESQNDFHKDDRQLLEASGLGKNWEQLESKYRVPGTGGETDVAKLAESILNQIKEEPTRLASILELEIAANPQRICEIVKAAMNAVEADDRQMTIILETVASTAPESLRLAAQCAIAVNPAALPSVQSTLARLDPGAGDGSSAKGSKAPSAKLAAPAADKGDPLDLPRLIIIPPFPPNPDWIPEVSESDPLIVD